MEPVRTRSDLSRPVETRFPSPLLPSSPPPSPPPQKKKKGEKGGGGGGGETRFNRCERVSTDLNGLKRVSTCFDRFKRVNLNGLKRVSTGLNVFQQV